MTAYYNENDRPAAAWLGVLADEGHLPSGVIDTRSIADVSGDDIRHHRECHFFAGIGGWPLALRLAGWPSNRPVWSGSCPCQPYSSAGKGKGDSDPRNLWPEFFRLIRECRPQCVFGEQVESAVGHGWLDGISADLEGEGYAIGAVVLGAHGVGAPHIRQRLYWVAHTGSKRTGRNAGAGTCQEEGGGSQGSQDGMQFSHNTVACRAVGGMAHARGERLLRGSGVERSGRDATERSEAVDHPRHDHEPRGLGDPDRAREGQIRGIPEGPGTEREGSVVGMEHTEGDGRIERRAESGWWGTPGGRSDGFWADFDIVHCRDGKSRRFEPGSFPLAHGVPGRVGLLRGYGNAIVPPVAAAFIRAYLEAEAMT